MSAWRHAVAIALLPGTVVVLVPGAIVAWGDEAEWGFGDGVVAGASIAAGAVLIAAGLALWAWTVGLFARVGKGTLAPWDPTQRLVVAGPYRHVRNPMISGVLAILLGEALVFGSTGVLLWAVVFFVINTLWFVLAEEPGLEKRFGDEYREYWIAVPRWIPRRAPWSPREGPS